MSKNIKYTTLAVMILLIGSTITLTKEQMDAEKKRKKEKNEAEMIFLGMEIMDADTMLVSETGFEELCSKEMVLNNFNYFNIFFGRIETFSKSETNKKELKTEIDLGYETLKLKYKAARVLYQNLKVAFDLRICYAGPTHDEREKEKNAFKQALSNDKNKCPGLFSSNLVAHFSRNYLVFEIAHKIDTLDKIRKLIDYETPMYKFVIDGTNLFHNENSKSKLESYTRRDYEYYLLKIHKEVVEKRENDSDELLPPLAASMKQNMHEFQLGAYACDLYERILYTFQVYVKDTKTYKKSVSNKIDEFLLEYDFIHSHDEFVDPMFKKFGPKKLCDIQDSKDKLRIGGLSQDNLLMNVHNFFYQVVLNKTKPENLDKTKFKGLYDYVHEGYITFWSLESINSEKEVTEITEFDSGYLKYLLGDESNINIKTEDNESKMDIKTEEYKDIYKKSKDLNFDIIFFQYLAEHYHISINEYKQNDGFYEKDEFTGLMFEAYMLMYKVYTFLRFKKVIGINDNTKIIIEKILKFFLDGNFDDFDIVYDDVDDRYFVLTYTYLLRIYFTEFLGMKDINNFQKLIEERKKDIKGFFDLAKLIELEKKEEGRFDFELLIYITTELKITIFDTILKSFRSHKLLEDLEQLKPELRKDIKSEWKEDKSRISNRKQIMTTAVLKTSDKKYAKLVNDDFKNSEVHTMKEYIDKSENSEISIYLKKFLFKNITKQKNPEILYNKLKIEVLTRIHERIHIYRINKDDNEANAVEYFIQFLDWLNKTHPPQFYGSLYKHSSVTTKHTDSGLSDFTNQFTNILLADFYFIVPKCLEIYGDNEQKRFEEAKKKNSNYNKNPIIGTCASGENNLTECKLKSHWLLGTDFSGMDFEQTESLLSNSLYDMEDELTFMVEMLPIFKHFRIEQSESGHKYNGEVREIFRDIYNFLISIRTHMYIADECPWITLFDGLEECLEFTYSQHYNSDSDSKAMCKFSYQRYSEMYWFLKFFQMEETKKDDVFFDLFNTTRQEELRKKNKKDYTLEDKKDFYHFTKINSFNIFLSYIIDVKQLPSNSFDSQEEINKLRIVKECQKKEAETYMFCQVLKQVLIIKGELTGSESGETYNLIEKSVQDVKDKKMKFIIWHSISVLENMSYYRGLDYFEKLNRAHDSFFSVDYFYKNRNRKEKTAIDPIFIINEEDITNYVDFIKMKFKPSPGLLVENEHLYLTIKEMLTKNEYKSAVDNLFFETKENSERKGLLGLGESVTIFLMFCDTDAFYLELAKKLILAPDFVLYGQKRKIKELISPLNLRLATVSTDINVKVQTFIEYFETRSKQFIALINPQASQMEASSEVTVVKKNRPLLKKKKRGASINQVPEEQKIEISVVTKIGGATLTKEEQKKQMLSDSGEASLIGKSTVTLTRKIKVIQTLEQAVMTDSFTANQIEDRYLIRLADSVDSGLKGQLLDIKYRSKSFSGNGSDKMTNNDGNFYRVKSAFQSKTRSKLFSEGNGIII